LGPRSDFDCQHMVTNIGFGLYSPENLGYSLTLPADTGAEPMRIAL